MTEPRCPVCVCSRHYGSGKCMCPDCPRPDPTPATAATAAPSGLHGRCVESTDGLLGQALFCSLLAGHDGMHHDNATGADWIGERRE